MRYFQIILGVLILIAGVLLILAMVQRFTSQSVPMMKGEEPEEESGTDEASESEKNELEESQPGDVEKDN